MGLRDDDEDGDPTVTDCDESATTGRLRRSHGTETCDGLDNDCNGVVDDGALMEPAGAPSVLATVGVDASNLVVLHDGATGIAVVWTASGGMTARSSIASRGDMGTPLSNALVPMSQSAVPFAFGNPFGAIDYVVGCYPGPRACSLGEAAATEIDVASGRRVVAAVDHLGCPAGRLLVGHLDRGSAEVRYVGPATRSATIYGVDASGAGACTGSLSMTPLGATRPAIEALDSGSSHHPQALLAWIGRAVTADACMVGDAPINAMGIWTEQNTSLPPTVWVTGSGANHPATLGMTRAD
ncbi:MAG: putative metal-binding motif-containing protein, partial [Deltaproteobacteria bacterium]